MRSCRCEERGLPQRWKGAPHTIAASAVFRDSLPWRGAGAHAVSEAPLDSDAIHKQGGAHEPQWRRRPRYNKVCADDATGGGVGSAQRPERGWSPQYSPIELNYGPILQHGTIESGFHGTGHFDGEPLRFCKADAEHFVKVARDDRALHGQPGAAECGAEASCEA